MLDVDQATGDVKEDGGPTSGGCKSSITQESGWPGEETSVKPPSGQVGRTGSSMEFMINLGEGGQDDGQLQEGDGEVQGEPQGQAGVQTGEKIDKNRISKLMSDWDAMDKYHDGVTGLLGEELEGGGGQRERRSKEFQNRINLFEELGEGRIRKSYWQ